MHHERGTNNAIEVDTPLQRKCQERGELIFFLFGFNIGESIILILDEFYVAVKYANQEKIKRGGEGCSLAENPTLLLDRLNKTPNLILITTSNERVDSFEERIIRKLKMQL